ncbi:hypothetical protein HW452_16750 [Halomonas aquamarina]|uniref:Uncharacterized protein n=1 Tax=Vreelandella aquamarina TaxID=77097 RepID=A0ACC5VZD6_9GAMM|nr:hypothetical protein [Halomonas aquamarina]MBZ5489171.1 hypothetical protein [Halomonas aquamarina]
MSLSNPKTVTEVFAAHDVSSGSVCVLLECLELALAVTLQGKYRVTLESGYYGIHCTSWPFGSSPRAGGLRASSSLNDLADIHLVRDHLNELLADSAKEGDQ